MWGHYSCTYCNDTWMRELTDDEVAAYAVANPDVDLTKTNEIELEEILCDGCEDFFQEEAAAWIEENGIKHDFDEYGTCCICEAEMEDTAIIQLNYKVESESGWGCFQCGLSMEGALAIVCIDCFDKYKGNIEDQIKYLMDGKKGRIPVPSIEEREPHEHDLSLHPEYNGI